jgi:trigger factor
VEIKLDKNGQNDARILISLDTPDYQPRVEAKIKEYAKQVKMNGFRPGKVPSGLVKKMYGKSLLVDEINAILGDTLNDYIKGQNLNLIGYPLPLSDDTNQPDWENPAKFDFSYEIGLAPEFELNIDAKTKVTRYLIQVEDKVLEETLTNLRNQFGAMGDAEAVVEESFISGTLKADDGSLETETLFPMNRMTEKGKKAFLGKKGNDIVSFAIEDIFEDAANLAHATGLSKDEAEVKKGGFSFAIKSIRVSQPAALNQEFFDKVFGQDKVSDLEGFNAKLRETIIENYDKESQKVFDVSLKNKVIEAHQLSFPEDFLKRWLFASNEGKVSKEDIEREFPIYTKELTWQLVKNKVGEKADIKIQEEEIIARANGFILQQFGLTEVPADMADTMQKITDNYLQRENGKAYRELVDQVFSERVLENLKSVVKIDDKPVSVEAFRQEIEKL